MKPPQLHPSSTNIWRTPEQKAWLKSPEWKTIREKIRERDNYTCVYCGYRAEKYQIVDHKDGDPENHSEKNLQTICNMCNYVKHSGFGNMFGTELYHKSKYNQVEIIQLTRKMYDEGKSEEEIKKFLGLEKVPTKIIETDSWVEESADSDISFHSKSSLYGGGHAPAQQFIFVPLKPNKDVVFTGWLKYHNQQLKEKLAVGKSF